MDHDVGKAHAFRHNLSFPQGFLQNCTGGEPPAFQCFCDDGVRLAENLRVQVRLFVIVGAQLVNAWGGQLQRNITGTYDPNGSKTDLQADDQPALTAKVAMLTDDMLEFAEKPRDVVILDENDKPLLGGDHDRRFFEASWMHKYNGKYYFSYSTGDTHYIVYAIGDSPYGPFKYAGRILEPVEGWTTHHSIVEWDGRWWLFYADSQLSGQTRLRNVKVTELFYNPDGTIKTIDPFVHE